MRSTKLAKAALQLAERFGWAVFPVRGKRPVTPHGFKDATSNPDEIVAIFAEHPEADGVAIACSSERGPIVLDVDDPGAEELVKSLDLPDTLTAISGKKGRHLYFAPDGKPIKRAIKLRDVGLDLLGDGGYVVAPPSLHPDTGKRYRWESKKRPARLPQSVPSAGQNRSQEIAIEAALMAENEERCDPPLLVKQVRKIARSIGSKPSGNGGGAELSGRLAADLTTKRIEWLWFPYIPLGELTLLDGDPPVDGGRWDVPRRRARARSAGR